MRPAVFLDRDGTLNEEVGYLHRPEEVVLVPGSVEAIARLNARGIPVIVVTNQAGIGQGKYGWKDFQAVMDHITALLGAEGAHVDGVYAAPHHERGVGEYRHPDHPDRMPNTGMLQRALEGVVGVGVQLLDVLALHVDLAGLAVHPGQPSAVHARGDQAGGQRDLLQQLGELRGCLGVGGRRLVDEAVE